MAQSRPPGGLVRPTVLLTRPQASAARFAAALRDRFGADLGIVISPLMALAFLRPDLPERAFEAVLFTSEAGVAASADATLGAGAVRLPRLALCVGDATAAAARAAGFDARSAGGDAPALIALARRTGLTGPLLHLRGVHATGDVAAHLTAGGLETVEGMAYEQVPQPVNAAAVALMSGEAPVILPVFSPRSAVLLAAEVARIGARAPLHVAALSLAVAEETRRLGAWCTRVAAEPRAVSMVEAIADLMRGHPVA